MSRTLARLARFDDNESRHDDDAFESENMDDMDSRPGVKERWKEASYVYDAAAERTKEWLKESGSQQSLVAKSSPT